MMHVRESILEELEKNVLAVRSEELEQVVSMIRAAKHTHNIFVYGRGREMMAISAFAARLNQLGYNAYIIGECHVPPMRENDLFLVTNGRNMLDAHAAQMRIAKQQGAKIVAFTAHPDGGFRSIPVDYIVRTSGQTLDDPIDFTKFYQTMGTAYEQALLVLLDSVALRIMEQDGIGINELEKQRTNLY